MHHPIVRDHDRCDYDYVIFMGRFQFFHNGHEAVARMALARGKRVIFAIGSAHAPRTPKNPLKASERQAMITACLDDAKDRLDFAAIPDSPYLEMRWLGRVQSEVSAIVRAHGDDPATAKIAIIGRNKDSSSYYLKSFPAWDLIEVERTEVMGATEMRDQYFTADRGSDIILAGNVPGAVFDAMMAFRRMPAYASLAAEHQMIKEYPSKWGKGPFVTADAVVFCAGHILVIERGRNPGKGLMALPGGFINNNETLLEGVIRELREETHLKVPKAVLLGSLKAVRVYDAVDRDPRARIYSHAHIFVLSDKTLPEVRGGDDAAGAKWVTIAEFLASPERCFLDHHAIGEQSEAFV